MSKLDDLITLAETDIDKAANQDIGSDDGELAKEIYTYLFDFYNRDNFSGDVVFTWKSPSLIEKGDYVGHRKCNIDNIRVIGNIFPNYISDHKYSLNLNRNGCMGDFPHDFIDVYMDHVAKYAFNESRPQIMEYYPLKRAILNESNKKYFQMFVSYDDFIDKNYFTEISKCVQDSKPFLDMPFEEFKKKSCKLMHNRGIIMLKKLKECRQNEKEFC